MSAHEQTLVDWRPGRQAAGVVPSLPEENRSLRVSQEQLATERSNLLAKNEQARSRVEAMIVRLRSLEQNNG